MSSETFSAAGSASALGTRTAPVDVDDEDGSEPGFIGNSALSPPVNPLAAPSRASATRGPPSSVADEATCDVCFIKFGYRKMMLKHRKEHDTAPPLSRGPAPKPPAVSPMWDLDADKLVVDPSGGLVKTVQHEDQVWEFAIGNIPGRKDAVACCRRCRIYVKDKPAERLLHAEKCKGVASGPKSALEAQVETPEGVVEKLTKGKITASGQQQYTCPRCTDGRSRSKQDLVEHLLQSHGWVHYARVGCAGSCCDGWRPFSDINARTRAHVGQVAKDLAQFTDTATPPPPGARKRRLEREEMEQLKRANRRPHVNRIPPTSPFSSERIRDAGRCPFCPFGGLVSNVRRHLMDLPTDPKHPGHGLPSPELYEWCECAMCDGGRAFWDKRHALRHHGVSAPKTWISMSVAGIPLNPPFRDDDSGGDDDEDGDEEE